MVVLFNSSLFNSSLFNSSPNLERLGLAEAHFPQSTTLPHQPLLQLKLLPRSIADTFRLDSPTLWTSFTSDLRLLITLCQVFLVGQFLKLRHHRNPPFRRILYFQRLSIYHLPALSWVRYVNWGDEFCF
jgi:hypothetical protein